MHDLIEIVPFKNVIYLTQLEDCSFCIPHIHKIKEETKSVSFSNKGGWQSPAYNYNSNEFLKPVLDSIKKYVLNVYAKMQVNGSAEVYYWFNINKKYSYNITHRHGRSYYSAVLYLKTPKDCGNLFFQRPDDAHIWIEHNSSVDGNWDTYWIAAEPNRLIIFPSYLSHFVEQNLTEESDDERISIALNFI